MSLSVAKGAVIAAEVTLRRVRAASMRVRDPRTMDESERPRELSPNPREDESDPSASAIAQDATFYTARRAIEKGLEHAPIGIDRRPGTKRPIFISAGWVGAQAPRSGGTAPPPAPTTRPPSPSQTRAEVPPAVER